MHNGQMDRGNENPTQHLPRWLRKTTKKTSVRLVGTGIRTRDLANASLVRYHGATSLGSVIFVNTFSSIRYQFENPQQSILILQMFEFDHAAHIH